MSIRRWRQNRPRILVPYIEGEIKGMVYELWQVAGAGRFALNYRATGRMAVDATKAFAGKGIPGLKAVHPATTYVNMDESRYEKLLKARTISE